MDKERLQNEEPKCLGGHFWVIMWVRFHIWYFGLIFASKKKVTADHWIWTRATQMQYQRPTQGLPISQCL